MCTQSGTGRNAVRRQTFLTLLRDPGGRPRFLGWAALSAGAGAAFFLCTSAAFFLGAGASSSSETGAASFSGTGAACWVGVTGSGSLREPGGRPRFRGGEPACWSSPARLSAAAALSGLL